MRSQAVKSADIRLNGYISRGAVGQIKGHLTI